MKKAILIVVVNIVLFFLLRYLNVVALYLINGKPNETFTGFWDFLPAYVIQALILMIVYIGKLRNDEHYGAFVYPLCVMLITLLYLALYLNLIPDIVALAS